ncbi:MAG TPA: hypothetical protein DCL66_10940 [Gammaproteobacteria bacterium]|nr:hypothetical protein [Gammaproteobacteria bacterium]|tara:strand:- start:25 stop:876 length:852 start_codon:yes stop_codon:yes gene_type:complete
MKKPLFLLFLAASVASVASAQEDVVLEEFQTIEPLIKEIDSSADELRSANIQETQMLESVMSRAEALEALVDKYPSIKHILNDDDAYERNLKQTLSSLYEEKEIRKKEAREELKAAQAALNRSSVPSFAQDFPPGAIISDEGDFPQEPTFGVDQPFSQPPGLGNADGAPNAAQQEWSQPNMVPSPAQSKPKKEKSKPLTSNLIVYASMGAAGPDGRLVTPVRAIVDNGGILTKSLKIGQSFEYSGNSFFLVGVTKKDDENLTVTFRVKGRLVNFTYTLAQRGV